MQESRPTSSSSSSEEPKLQTTQLLSTTPLNSIFRILYPFLLFMSTVSPIDAQGIPASKCFNIDDRRIDGGDYRRLRGIPKKECGRECKDDPSCLAYQYDEALGVCYLKSRSLSGELQRSEMTSVGFCLDESEYDESRDRFLDHVALGNFVAEKTNIEGDDCRSFCMLHPDAQIYSFVPDDLEDDEATIGTCTCIESLRGVTLFYNAFSGVIPPRRHHRRIKSFAPFDSIF